MRNRTLKVTLVTPVIALLLATSAALAQTMPPQPLPENEAPTSADDCLRAAFDVAEQAENKKLSNDDLDKVEELLTKMESHCDARQFQEAMLVHKDIKTLIEQR